MRERRGQYMMPSGVSLLVLGAQDREFDNNSIAVLETNRGGFYWGILSREGLRAQNELGNKMQLRVMMHGHAWRLQVV